MTPPGNQPIGYWLKKLDELLTRRIQEAQHQAGFTRLGWQLLQTVSQTSPAPFEALAALAPFASPPEIQQLLEGFRAKGWLQKAQASYALTAAGQRLYQQRLEAQQRVREQVVRGISAEEYALTLAVLQRMAQNLAEPEAPQP
ncbi:MarR family winged helix-turn-helix transcriptional regulator [Hymenobacter guriensis]|uniref:Winged helix-turn-helix transcriptional regulator n=1 Tax=Hymenobacter guriensis TaxID=2793065 RepID=A0ABS0KW59_9BACT|nr:MarR family winged helix-turn-helix transcriptional regulator [Hymenobacter guriensis]MBG8552071.1 winged helix-turn-helix transcriptional regulator [Hymenobacter guriensis]